MKTSEQVAVHLPHDEISIKFSADETIVFVASSGHCNLDCEYCIISPVVKHQESLTYDDLLFIKNSIGGKIIFIFSGKGDFFSGYRNKDRLLYRLLEHDDIGVVLDINGVVIHCFPDLTTSQLAKIRHINLTYHYHQLKQHNALKLWRKNAITMLQLHDSADFFVNIILSPLEISIWEEALNWYEENLFKEYPKKIVFINDVIRPFSTEHEIALSKLAKKFGHLVKIRRGNFEDVLNSVDHVSCPAGQSYFRVWNDGTINACPYITELRNSGNAKQCIFLPRSEPYYCKDFRHYDCYYIAYAKRMIFYKQS
jgi:hypothetical protein